MAGLILEVVLESPDPAADPQARRHLVKTRLKDTLVSHLAGRVTLDRFRTLVSQLDRWFPLYYPLVAPDPGFAAARGTAPDQECPFSEPPPRRPIREEVLRVWLTARAPELLPQRPQSKINLEKLWDFLRQSQGGWFKVKDFQHHFGIDRKTAWEYLHKLLTAGLLRHNRERSSAVRYCLEERFLVVRAEAVQRRVNESLAPISAAVAAAVGDWLLATGGEPFWEQEWQGRLESAQLSRVFSALEAAGLLEVVHHAGGRRMLRLPQCWRWPGDEEEV